VILRGKSIKRNKRSISGNFGRSVSRGETCQCVFLEGAGCVDYDARACPWESPISSTVLSRVSSILWCGSALDCSWLLFGNSIHFVKVFVVVVRGDTIARCLDWNEFF
jgi:hypothetical protein